MIHDSSTIALLLHALTLAVRGLIQDPLTIATDYIGQDPDVVYMFLSNGLALAGIKWPCDLRMDLAEKIAEHHRQRNEKLSLHELVRRVTEYVGCLDPEAFERGRDFAVVFDILLEELLFFLAGVAGAGAVIIALRRVLRQSPFGRFVTELLEKLPGLRNMAEELPEPRRPRARQLVDELGDAARRRAPERIPAITPPTRRGGLRRAMLREGQPPANLTRPQAHHDLSWNYREWFAGEGRGLNVNDPQFGRWVEGTPPGRHQQWSGAFDAEWQRFIRNHPNASREQVLDFMNQLRGDPRFQ